MFYETIWEYGGCKLVRRPDTTNYHITWYRTGSGRVRRRSTGTDDLDTAKAELIAFVQAKGSAEPERGQAPLLDLLSGYVQRTVAGRHRWQPEQTALKHWTEFCEDHDVVYVNELTRAMQERYVQWRREALRRAGFKASNATLGRELRVMRAALNDAWREGILDQAARVIGLTEPPPRQRFLFPEEVERLMAACEEDYLRRFCLIALHTLQRPGAIFQLRSEQVDLRLGRIDFLPEGEVQSRKRRPVVPISGTLRPVLIEAMDETWSGYLIERHGRPVQNVRKGFAAARTKAGLGPEVTPYTLRHTGATLLLAAGVPIRQVSAMLGHTEQRTTEMYGKHHVAFLGEVVEALDWMYGGHTPAGRASYAPESRNQPDRGRIGPSQKVLAPPHESVYTPPDDAGVAQW